MTRIRDWPFRKGAWAVLGLAVALAVVAGCGVPQDDYDALQAQLDAQTQTNTSLQTQLAGAQQQATSLEQQKANLEGQLATQQQQAADLQGRLSAAEATVTSLEGQAAGLPLVISADVVRGHTRLAGPSCALNSRYPYGELVVWRVRVTNAETGDMIPANPADLVAQATPPTAEEVESMSEGIEVVVHLADGQTFPMHFAGHGGTPSADYFWTSSWEVPDGYPTGTIQYWITANWPDQQKTGRWDPIQVSSSYLTITGPLE